MCLISQEYTQHPLVALSWEGPFIKALSAKCFYVSVTRVSVATVEIKLVNTY